MSFLLDTNIWLERLLDQEKPALVGSMLDALPVNTIHISDFSLHSIGVILTRYEQHAVLAMFVDDLFENGLLHPVSLEAYDFKNLISNSKRFNLDFDDAYQLTISQKFDFTIVTFDKDFDAKEIEKVSPEEVMKEL